MKALMMITVMFMAVAVYAESGMKTLAEQNGSSKKTLDSLIKKPVKKESSGIKDFKADVDQQSAYYKTTLIQHNSNMEYYKPNSKEWTKAKTEKDAIIKRIGAIFADRLDSMPDADKKAAKAYLEAQLKMLDTVKD